MMQTQDKSLTPQLVRIDDILLSRKPQDAEAPAQKFVDEHPHNIDGLILLGRAQLAAAHFQKAHETAQRALSLDAKHPIAQLLMIEALLRIGRPDEGFTRAEALEAARKYDPVILMKIGQFYTQTNRHREAARCYERVRVLRPAESTVAYALASARIAAADMEGAEALFNQLLRRNPHDYDAYYNRATLRKQTNERNHVADMERVLNGPLDSEVGETILCFSLAKELEDMGLWARSFAYLKRGADARRHTFHYSVEPDVRMLDEIRVQQDERFFSQAREGYAPAQPLFVIGMPRSGTTLVERILSSHSQVGSVGESDEFMASLLRQLGGPDGQSQIVFRNADKIDYATVGREYHESLNRQLPGFAHIVNKTPSNFYYVGMILTALPNAKIVHLRRHPVDTCYAIYKTLFRNGYSYSYDLTELGQFYLAYRRLMDHWRAVLPGKFLDIDYEELVANQEDVTRRMIAHCGLDWEDACLSFEKNESPSLTASAAQVRQPIYKSSVALWRRYEKELAPLIRVLRAGGLEFD